MQELHRHRLALLEVPALVDHAHPAGAELLVESIAAVDGRADFGVGYLHVGPPPPLPLQAARLIQRADAPRRQGPLRSRVVGVDGSPLPNIAPCESASQLSVQ